MSPGKIVQIIGAVVDVEFGRDDVPKIYAALKVTGTEITQEGLYVNQHGAWQGFLLKGLKGQENAPHNEQGAQ